MPGFSLASAAFTHGGEIPSRFTCEGEDLSPPLDWTGAPEGTRSLVLVVDDPDAPDPAAPQRTWVHWVLFDIPASAAGLGEAAGNRAILLPTGTRPGLNDWGRSSYGGPCPPIGRHRYFFEVYALDAPLGDLGTPTKSEVEAAMQGHVLAVAELVGTYEKQH